MALDIIIKGVKCKLVPDAGCGEKPKCYKKSDDHSLLWFPAPAITPPFLQPSTDLEEVGSDDIEICLKDPAATLYPRTSPKYTGFVKNPAFPMFWVHTRLPQTARLLVFKCLYGENEDAIVQRYNWKRSQYLAPRPVVERGSPLPTHARMPPAVFNKVAILQLSRGTLGRSFSCDQNGRRGRF